MALPDPVPSGRRHPKLHPDVRAIYDANPPPPEWSTLSPAEIRALPVFLAAAPEAVAGVVQRSIPGPGGWIALRIYRPEGAGPHPAMLYLHGGGMVFGGLDMTDRFCRAITNSGRCVVVSVDYRLAPETKYPGPLEDVYEALQWLSGSAVELTVDPRRIGVGGFSAGGNLAAAVALLSRDRAGPAIAFQLLVMPTLDPGCDSSSMREFAAGPVLTQADIRWFWGHYLRRPEDATDPYVSPLAADDLRGLPPAFIVTAGCDPLYAEGEAYAERLTAAGVEVTARRYDGMPHGFLGFVTLDAAKRAMTDIGEAIRAHL